MPDKILQLTSQILNNPVTVSIALSKPAEGVEQIAYSVYEEQKNPLLVEILKSEDWKSVIVFSGTKRIVSQIDAFLQKKGLNSRAISSDLEQGEREEVLLGFRNRRIPILVATNVVSRGIDIDDIEMVINFDVPRDAEEYVHRIGRTARASRKGRAVTLVSPGEQGQFHRIEQLIGQVVLKPEAPASLGPTPEYAPSGKRRREGEGSRPKGKGGFKKQGGDKRRFKSNNGKPKSNPNGGGVGE
ncbi:MAG: DEAD/DEAH box helicase [Flavobacteriales bacterium]|nr:DEAD/DEAH box helicase [Flavobacteriales bacterium]